MYTQLHEPATLQKSSHGTKSLPGPSADTSLASNCHFCHLSRDSVTYGRDSTAFTGLVLKPQANRSECRIPLSRPHNNSQTRQNKRTVECYS